MRTGIRRRRRIDIHDGGAGFHKTTDQKTALPPTVTTITIEQIRAFTVEIESPRHSGTGQDIEGGSPETVDSIERTIQIDRLPITIQLTDQRFAFDQPDFIDARRQLQIG